MLPENFWKLKHLEVYSGDVIVTKAGPRHRVGVAAYVGHVQPHIIVSGKMVLLRVDRSRTDPRFLAAALSAPAPQGYLNACKTGMAESQMNFANEDLMGTQVPLPGIEEQRRIADFLDVETVRVDQLIRARAQTAALVNERQQAIRDAAIDEAFRNFGEVPLRRLVLGITQGSSPQCDNVPREADEWAVLKLSAVRQGVFRPRENKRLPDDAEPLRAHELRPGDLLITRANTPGLVGDAALAEGHVSRLLLPDLIYRLEIAAEVDPGFVLQCVLGTRTRQLIQAVARGSSQSMVKLRGEDILDWRVPAIDGKQQRKLASKIADGLASGTGLPNLIERQLDLLAERRQALVTAAVTGQFDVATARGVDVT